MNQPPWPINEVPKSYERIGWEERKERIPADYGVAIPANPHSAGMTSEELVAHIEERIRDEEMNNDLIPW